MMHKICQVNQQISATKSYVYYIDPTYTLEQDIPKYNRYGQYEGVYKKGLK